MEGAAGFRRGFGALALGGLVWGRPMLQLPLRMFAVNMTTAVNSDEHDDIKADGGVLL